MTDSVLFSVITKPCCRRKEFSVWVAPVLTVKDASELIPNGVPSVSAMKKGIATRSSENLRNPPRIVCSHPDLDLVLKEISKIVNIIVAIEYVHL